MKKFSSQIHTEPVIRTEGGLRPALRKLLDFFRPDHGGHIGDPLREKVAQKEAPQNRPWRLLQVESAIACNLRCVMCPWKEISKKAGHGGVMLPHVWQAIRPYLREVRSIDFTGGGEPLLQPKLEEWIAEAKTAGCETGFLSNGLLLRKERQWRLSRPKRLYPD